jgi:hypothetical protein
MTDQPGPAYPGDEPFPWDKPATPAGSRGDQMTDVVLAAQGYVPPQVEQFGRTLDPVRGAALAAAIDAINALMPGTNMTVERVLETARTFEAYLTGKEEQQP